MNKLLTMASVAIAAMAIYSCDEDTAAIGQSLTNETDKLSLTSANYEVSTRTIVADSVYTLSNTCYFGCVEDPETGTEVKSEFTSQIHIDEEMYIFPDAQILSRYNDGPAADSCDLVIYVQSPFSVKDSLTAIKMCVSELSTPMEAGQRYYSNYNPLKRGMVREDGIRKEKMFTYGNLTDSDSLRATTGYFHNIRIPLNDYYDDLGANFHARCEAMSSMTSSGVSCTPSARRSPNTRISGMRALASRPVLAGRSSASIVIDAMLCTRCCLVFAERGAVGFATNRPFGRVPFAAGIACEASNPSVSAVTEPHAAIVIVGLLSFVQRLVRTTVPFGTRARPAGLIPAHGAPDRIRTDDTRSRRAVLYPLSYQGKQPAIIHSGTACGQRCGFRRAANHSRGG